MDEALLHAPVIRVELFEDRAAVTRSLTLPAPGRHRLRIGPLTPLVSEQTVMFPGGTQATLEEARVERIRTTRTEADPASILSLEQAWQTAQERAEASSAGLRRAEEAAARGLAALELALGASARGLALGEPEGWIQVVDELTDHLREARIEVAKQRITARLRGEEADRLSQRLAAARIGRPVCHAILHLSVLAEAAGRLLIRYVVPCAVWRPAHRAVLTSSPEPRVSWELQAVCWNATGEDWEDVELICSTARPGELADPPQLCDDVLSTRRRSSAVVVEARDEIVEVARERQGRRSSGLPGVDDGGEPRTFSASERAVLPSDGRPLTVTLERWQSDASVEWLALPERAGAAILRTVQHNAGPRPLLAGPVQLSRDGTVIGRGRIALVPPGEPFPLGWGSHDGLRISRREEHEIDRRRLSGRQLHTFARTIRVSHLGAEPCTLTIRERVPTGEIKEVRVGSIEADPVLSAGPDPDGFCRWSLELSPGQTRILTLRYTIDAASNVVLPF
ncbi:MAG TPA: mucoidy inhibitor MuiA family protein [Deltaproteobacteria bacterium]|nr:mucoidy inhibitor MuiA family protein [Deltaproteobacteria bacterium]